MHYRKKETVIKMMSNFYFKLFNHKIKKKNRQTRMQEMRQSSAGIRKH